jgi:Domain of unknown function (DUF2760)
LRRVSSAFRSFFAILFGGMLPEDIAQQFGYTKAKPAAPVAPTPELPKASDGALQMLGILQRDARLIDFLMEDIAGYTDDQVGAAVRSLHSDCRASLTRHFKLLPVIDSVEGTFQKLDSAKAPDPNRIKLLGNVPATGKSSGGILRHKGWVADAVNLPSIGKQDVKVVAPAEIEVE